MITEQEIEEPKQSLVKSQPRRVSDDEVEKALSYLRDSAREIGGAKERLVKAGHMVKHVEALMFLASEERSADARRASARTTDEYVEAINEEAIAAGEYERMKSLREAASAYIEAWRTEGANYRAMRI